MTRILGYTQRASVPTACDLKLSSELTNSAVDLALKMFMAYQLEVMVLNTKALQSKKLIRWLTKTKKMK